METKKIEKKWQKYWKENKTFEASNTSQKDKYYILVEFPYPSGSGLHVGHVRSYASLDAVARKKRMEGYNVLFPMGWDAFGLPAEEYAIKNHVHPSVAVKENIKTFKGQLQSLGLSFDWSREFATTDPKYYKWTQWQFLKFYEAGLAYKDSKTINWCPSCKIGLANEEVEGGNCERCGGPIVHKEKEQWMLGMKKYADKLLNGLDDTEFQEKTKIAQINWIGKSRGAEIDFSIDDCDEKLRVYTTRPDTIFGVTFMVIAPEHPILNKLSDRILNMDEIKEYQEFASHKSEMERTQLNKEKTGVKILGFYAINPLTKEKIPVYISDYVMMNYGTGAIMAVPAHDDRDYEFAKKFGIDIVEVIKGGNIEESAYIGDGEMVNSSFLNGIETKEEAINKMLEYLDNNGIGHASVKYRLQDWVFSRQRFWGEPIPMINCPECGWVPVPYEDLPVKLPNVASYEPTENGESPLASIPEFVNCKCPKCGADAKRETDTMPNWAGSSWYWLRYMDPTNDSEFVSPEALNYWGKVDWYNGGMEHATRHLLYARFWNNFLYDQGLVPNNEPFKVRTSHGMILGANGEKMSKSKGNVINPNDCVDEFGADALRVYEMFIGDYEKEVSWSTNSLNGCKKFLDRVERIGNKLSKGTSFSPTLEVIMNKTIKKVTEDLDNLKYNTAISSLMILLNEMEKLETITKKDYRTLLLLLNPMAPHITEELNEIHDLGAHLCESKWPKYDPEKLVEDVVTIAVQVNGKLRGTIEVNLDSKEEKIKKLAMENENVSKHLEGKEIVKVIVIKNKIVNIVVR
ncbi:MAG: leucine--tRNA ligase [Bacilli bacterium]|nr:leucine--tRNA ligase [Bacilli bacterium]